MTKAEARKQKKRKDRERRIRHEANIRRNAPANQYRLDVLLDGKWYLGVMSFKTIESVTRYKRDIESKRQKGEGVIAGKIICLETGEVVETIDPSLKSMKGALPDTLADKPESAQKAVLDNKPTEEPYSV